MAGIQSYGYYVPRYRIRIADIAAVWGKNATEIERSLGLTEKSVAHAQEDSLTMGYESAHMALEGEDPSTLGAVFFGTESPAYAVNPSSTILAELLGVGNSYLAYDTQFACKAATGAFISTLGLVDSGQIKQGLVCASDKATGKPHDALEYTAASGSVSLVVGKDEAIADVEAWTSFSSDTPDFWRREGIRYPSHGGRFTGKPSYFFHLQSAVREVMKKTGLKQSDFAHIVFHMPNGRFPVQAAEALGFEVGQIKQSLVVTQLGNSYTASSLLGLVSIFDIAQPDERILLASYGSGAGSDAFVLRTTKHISKKRKNFARSVSQKEYISYPTYLKFMRILQSV